MRLGALALVLLGLSGEAQAQQPVTGEPPLNLQVTTAEATVVVQALGAISCQTVAQQMLCQQTVIPLLLKLREQLKALGK